MGIICRRLHGSFCQANSPSSPLAKTLSEHRCYNPGQLIGHQQHSKSLAAKPSTTRRQNDLVSVANTGSGDLTSGNPHLAHLQRRRPTLVLPPSAASCYWTTVFSRCIALEPHISLSFLFLVFFLFSFPFRIRDRLYLGTHFETSGQCLPLVVITRCFRHPTSWLRCSPRRRAHTRPRPLAARYPIVFWLRHSGPAASRPPATRHTHTHTRSKFTLPATTELRPRITKLHLTPRVGNPRTPRLRALIVPLGHRSSTPEHRPEFATLVRALGNGGSCSAI